MRSPSSRLLKLPSVIPIVFLFAKSSASSFSSSLFGSENGLTHQLTDFGSRYSRIAERTWIVCTLIRVPVTKEKKEKMLLF